MAPTPAAPTDSQRTGVILALACLAQFMVILDVSVVNVALPAIKHDLHYSQGNLQWVVDAYALTFAGFLLLGGRLADLYGRRRVFLLGLGLFTLASMVGGFATSDTVLTAARAGQGLGGAVLAPASLTILMTTFTDGPSRHRALGIWSSMAAAGGASGVVLGGLLVQYASWRWVLFINLPLGVAGAVVALRALPELARDGQRRRLDIGGAVTVTAGLATVVYAIAGTTTHAWGSRHTLVTLAIGVALLVAFLVIQRTVAQPLMPFHLLKSRGRSAANVVMLLVGGAFFSMWYFLSLYLQDVLGYSAVRAGLSFLPMTIAIIAGSLGSSRLVSRFGPRPPLVAGTCIAAGSFLWLSQLEASSTYVGALLVPSTLLALGLGLSITPLATAATSDVEPRDAGLASGLLNTARQVGGALGLAVLATAATSRTGGLLATHSSKAVALTSGFDRAFEVGSALCLAGTVVALLVPGAARARDDRVAVAAAD